MILIFFSEIVTSMVKGDYVEVNEGNDCYEMGRVSLATAMIQRTVNKESSCNPQKRAVWMAFEKECINEVRKIFEENNFVISDETNPAISMNREDVDVPIFLVNADFHKICWLIPRFRILLFCG